MMELSVSQTEGDEALSQTENLMACSGLGALRDHTPIRVLTAEIGMLNFSAAVASFAWALTMQS